MNIGIIGYGNMGKEIEKQAIKQGCNILWKINSKNKHDLNFKNVKKIDVAIEFSNPNSAFKNIKFCINNKIPIVSGTTGWLHQFEKIQNLCSTKKGTFLYAPNFSIGMNIFFEINNYISKFMSSNIYNVEIEEKHHIMKKDIPSGTAIKIKNDIDMNFKKTKNSKFSTPIISKRLGQLKGEHIVRYFSHNDEIKISHKSFNRRGFAKGALLAAKFIKNKKGLFTINDLINTLKL